MWNNKSHIEGQNEMDFINNIQYNGSSNNGYSFFQKYGNSQNFPLVKFNFINNGQM
jgi:hypothetical protein